AGREERRWGVFLPLYALRSKRSWTAGNLADLGHLLEWVHGLGGDVVGTLPLLAAFLDEPFDPSPYAPASRLFWNEFYLDIEGIPELERSEEARALLASDEMRRDIERTRSGPHVDFRHGM